VEGRKDGWKDRRKEGSVEGSVEGRKEERKEEWKDRRIVVILTLAFRLQTKHVVFGILEVRHFSI
jgi:hypothetical protein